MHNTVEPPNNGHIVDNIVLSFVYSRTEVLCICPIFLYLPVHVSGVCIRVTSMMYICNYSNLPRVLLNLLMTFDLILYTWFVQTLTTAQQELPVLEEEEVEGVDSMSNDKDESPPTENEEPTEQSEAPENQSHDLAENKLSNGTLSEFLSNEVACASSRHKAGVLSPYGLPCLRELLRFLISIINSSDR